MNASIGVLKSLRILFGYRHRLLEAIRHDVRQRYTGSVFGTFWAFLFPFLQLCIYAGLYTFVFKVRPSGLTEMGYVLLVFSGMIPLMAFNESLTGATSSLSANKNLLMNTVFPAELIPVRAALAAQTPSMIGVCIVMALGVVLGRTSWEAFLLVPFFWIVLMMFSIGLGWMFSLLSLVARDIQHGLGIVIMLLFVLSPFAYTPEMVPTALKMVIYINPMSYFVLTFQQLICYGNLPTPLAAGGAVALGLTAFFAGFRLFQRTKHVFFDYA